jgi:hypothetical protein
MLPHTATEVIRRKNSCLKHDGGAEDEDDGEGEDAGVSVVAGPSWVVAKDLN